MDRSNLNREPNAFDRAVLREIDTIRAIGRERLRSRDEVDDFAQEVVMRAYAYRDQARDADRLGAWVRAIARNTSRNWNARRRPTPYAVLPEVSDPDASSSRPVEDEERWARLLDALHALDETDRALLIAHVVEEAPYATLVERHGMSRTAVGVRLHRARKRLRRRIGEALAGVGALFGWPERDALGAALAMKTKWTVGIGVGLLAGALTFGGVVYLTDFGGDGSTQLGSTPGGVANSVTVNGARTPSTAATAERATRVSAPVASGAGGARPAPATDPAGAATSAGLSVAGPAATSPPGDAERRSQRLYDDFAHVYPLYLDALARYTQSIETRPKFPGSGAPEGEKEAFRQAFRAYRAHVMDPISGDIRRYEAEIQGLFPDAVTVRDDPERGRVWSLDQDVVRRAVGGRLPDEPAGS
ncbi:sigma-70 family RNA polymerase sigma factor [Candidatus Poribacteria bacterium]|jgi:RNA polymerase sigma-70 factor, ECF subfamily|nr:sigma-70 family RNA polymerase sigma factor [Candidatus Poribacteria bacterium]MBT5532565.1 sigma-70 family RNA polymerase sigma factor [Candidatus Poribacteria bacterium]MBT5710384.1 sigma-70 family RNA polymerase sigma factor [Candidatus Poribacteria bacterium]MBT7101826.1 sigma-70 family RNA polymerase sigma factor [Candidatus Poribacteria bacterium]MBT7806198.1 sigma-70 family RNA polymerase sigma factor [Candidatus Poribacteria bacterium]